MNVIVDVEVSNRFSTNPQKELIMNIPIVMHRVDTMKTKGPIIARNFLTLSDETLKERIANIDPKEALEYIMNLNPCTVNGKNASFSKNDALPNESIHHENDSLIVDQTALMAYLVASVKEINNRI